MIQHVVDGVLKGPVARHGGIVSKAHAPIMIAHSKQVVDALFLVDLNILSVLLGCCIRRRGRMDIHVVIGVTEGRDVQPFERKVDQDINLLSMMSRATISASIQVGDIAVFKALQSENQNVGQVLVTKVDGAVGLDVLLTRRAVVLIVLVEDLFLAVLVEAFLESQDIGVVAQAAACVGVRVERATDLVQSGKLAITRRREKASVRLLREAE